MGRWSGWVGGREARRTVTQKRVLLKRRSMGRRLACTSRASPAVVFNTLVMSLAVHRWAGINFSIMATEPRCFLPVGER